jgi:hypothetical protein
MSRRDPCVVVRFGIEEPPRVQVIADSPEDFQRLKFAIRSDELADELVSDAITADIKSGDRRRMNNDILDALWRASA